MAVSTLGYVVIRLTLPLVLLKHRQVRSAANAWTDLYGSDALKVIRERIAACGRKRERRRLYRLHDEIARKDPSWGREAAGPSSPEG